MVKLAPKPAPKKCYSAKCVDKAQSKPKNQKKAEIDEDEDEDRLVRPKRVSLKKNFHKKRVQHHKPMHV